MIKDEKNYHIDIELKNPKSVTEYYYAGIKVHTVDNEGNLGYPMGKNWIDNRLRISWESITVDKLAVDTKGLEDAIKTAKEIKNEDGTYSAGSFDKLQKAIEEAEAILGAEDKTTEQVDKAVKSLNEKKDKLVEISGLKAALDEAKTVDQSLYTEASLVQFNQTLTSAENSYKNANVSVKAVDTAIQNLADAKKELVQISKEELNKNALADGTYTVGVNLWHADNDQPSMGDDALYHTAQLTVKDGTYTLNLKGHQMTMMGMTGGLEKLRIIPDGTKPAEDESNYVEKEVRKEGTDYLVDIELANPTDVSDYYYAGIVIHTIGKDGSLGYPMGQNWMDNRLRISWESLTVQKLDVNTSALEAALTEAKEIKNEDGTYSAGSFDKLQKAIEEAEAILGAEDKTTEQVDKAVKSLNEKKDKLVEISGLKAALDEAKTVDQSLYTEASLVQFNQTLTSAENSYKNANVSVKAVDTAIQNLADAKKELVQISKEELNKNALADGTYTVGVNLWHADNDQPSMGDDALYHTAQLTVKDGTYTLNLKGHQMTMMGMTGGLEKLRIIPDGTKPAEDESNYVEKEVRKEGTDYLVDIELANPTDVSDYYYAGIVIHTIGKDGSLGYPMGQNWMDNRLRISWESLTVQKLDVNTSALKAALTEAKEIKNEDGTYSAGSFEELQEAVKDAETVLDAEDKTTEQVENAVKALNEKKEKLVVISNLKATIDRAEELLKETETYTTASLAQLKDTVKNAKAIYYQENPSQTNVDDAAAMLEQSIGSLMEISGEELDKNNLQDGKYTVGVNLWHEEQDKESMGNDALYHTAVLTVEDGTYTLRLSGHQMTVGTQTGELDALRIVPDGSEPKGDGSNYKELKIEKDGSDYYIDVELENPTEVSEYYYGGIKVHTVDAKGQIGYPMGENWIGNRLRISWESLALKESAENYPAFSATDEATGITVSAKEGALPKGTKLEVSKITDQEKVGEINKTLVNLAEKNTPYQISLYVEKNGVKEVVEPKNGMELTISLPVPAEYNAEKVTCYYLDKNNYANALTGTLKDGMYTVANSKIGIYAVSEKKGKEPTYVIDTNKKGEGITTETGKKPVANGAKPAATSKKPAASTASKAGKVKTADTASLGASVLAMLTAMTAAAGTVLFRRKKEDPEEDV